MAQLFCSPLIDTEHGKQHPFLAVSSTGRCYTILDQGGETGMAPSDYRKVVTPGDYTAIA